MSNVRNNNYIQRKYWGHWILCLTFGRHNKQSRFIYCTVFIYLILLIYGFFLNVVLCYAYIKCTMCSVPTSDCILTLQRRTKQKVVTDFATVTKGTSAGAKPRAALRQVLFSQGASDKNSVSEVLQCLQLITVHADMLRNRYWLALTAHTMHRNNCSTSCSGLLKYF